MKRKLFLAVIFASPLVIAAVPDKSKISSPSSPKSAADTRALYEQLSGQPRAAKKVNARATQPTQVKSVPSNISNPKVAASAQKALTLARQSRAEKNYILAIKRYNFILKYYSKTPQAKMALVDKASLYKEMGLAEQAAYNQKRLSTMQSSAPKPMTSKTSSKKPSTTKR